MNKFLKLYIIRIFILGFFFIHWGVIHAQTYYVSSLDGDDRNNGTSPETAWATIDEVNRQIPSLRPGNSILFERRGTYYGSITIPANVHGLIDYPITFGAYGEGEAPVISGAKQITGWVRAGNNLWKAKVSEHPISIDVLFINGKKYYPARFPNKGYRTVTDRYSSGLQDKTLNFSAGYWNGATVAYRTRDWNIFRDTVSYSYADGRIDKVGNNLTQIPNPGWGYFLQNHINAIDTNGEWVYDKKDGTLTLRTLENPNEQLVEFMNSGNAFNIKYTWTESPDKYTGCYLIIENLCLQHYRSSAIYARYGKKIEIRHNMLINCSSGITIGGFNECLVFENIISDMENIGMRIGNLNDSRIYNNVIRRIAVSLDGERNGSGGYGIVLGMVTNNTTPNDRCEITGNMLDSIGYDGIMVCFSQNLLIKNNVINYSMVTLTDGGGIYLGTSVYDPPTLRNNKVIDNIVLNTIGNFEGTTKNYPWTHGIYLDDGIGNYEIRGNTVANAIGGLFFHGAHSNRVHQNVLYNNYYNIISQDESFSINNHQIIFTNNDLQNNYMYKNDGTTYNMVYKDPDKFCNNIIDNNYISTPFSQYFAYLNWSTSVNRATWSTKTDFDLHSRAESVTYTASGAKSPDEFAILVYNPTPKDSVIFLNHTYMSFEGTVYAGSIHLPPFKSAILFRCKDVVEQLAVPAGETNLCIGASSIYRVPESFNISEADTVVWLVEPPAAGIIKSMSGNKGSLVEIEWLPNFQPSPVQLTYNIRMHDGSSRISETLIVDLEQDNGRPPTPIGPTEITDVAVLSTYTADNPIGTEIQWVIPDIVGTLSSYDHYGNTATVSWNQNLLGTYTITYRLKNSCGEWGAEALPLHYSFPVAAPSGITNLCEGAYTCFTAPSYTDMVSDFSWVLLPANAGYLVSNDNEVCVTLNKNADNGKIILYYNGLNNQSLPFQSPPLTLTLTPLPRTPARPTGPASLPWTISSSTYTADRGWDDYDWQILPSTAGTISQNGNIATIDWAGGTDHDYAGQVQISYRVKKKMMAAVFQTIRHP